MLGGGVTVSVIGHNKGRVSLIYTNSSIVVSISLTPDSAQKKSNKMVLPSVIHEVSLLDPLLLLPLSEHLPPSPLSDLPPLLSALEQHLDPSPSSSKIPLQVLSAQMRQIMRRSQVLLNASRAGAGKAREGLDQRDVHLRGMEYERDRVREEIERCEDYA